MMQCFYSIQRQPTSQTRNFCHKDHEHQGNHEQYGGHDGADKDQKRWFLDPDRIRDEFIRHVEDQFDEWKKLWRIS